VVALLRVFGFSQSKHSIKARGFYYDMATELIMPRLPDQQPPAFYPPPTAQQPPVSYSQPQIYNNPQISPLSTSGNPSPTSPKPYITRQIRPLYMPAVLRPTEFPSKAPPSRPKCEDDEEGEDDQSIRSNSRFIGIGSLGSLGILSRRSTCDSGKGMNGSWNLDMFPKPTGSPTREHWKVSKNILGGGRPRSASTADL
jgi:hypothetical protein